MRTGQRVGEVSWCAVCLGFDRPSVKIYQYPFLWNKSRCFCLKRNKVELHTAGVSVCPSRCLSPLHLGSGSVPWYGCRDEGATPGIQYSFRSALLCANTIQILNYSLFYFVKCLTSQCRQIAAGTAIVFAGLLWGCI